MYFNRRAHIMDLGAILTDHNPWWKDASSRRASRLHARRDLHAEVLQHVGRAGDRRAAVIIGPRQVGKTTLLLQVADDLLEGGWSPRRLTYFDFSDDRLTEPVPARQLLDAASGELDPQTPRVFLLDEIRLSPSWSKWLKQAVDHTPHRFIVTDSAASLLRDGSRESGAGRWDQFTMEGLTFSEYLRLLARPGESEASVMNRVPNIVERYLVHGGFPEHIGSDTPDETRARLRSDIADRAIRRDLGQLDNRVDVEQVAHLFAYLMRGSGDLFDAVSRARDLGADPRSVRSWTHLLEEAMLVVPLERRTDGGALLRAKAKLYAADHGLVSAFAPVPAPLGDDEVRGRIWEAVVYRHMRFAATALGGRTRYFRQNDDLEVDFVFDSDAGAVAVEVTASAAPSSRKLARLKQGAERLGAARALLVCGVPAGAVRDGIQFVPLGRFLLDPIGTLQGTEPGRQK